MRQQRYLWCLDNGHASTTPGKRSPRLEDGRQLLEYEINRDVLSRVAAQLDEACIANYIVTPEYFHDVPLAERVDRANSIHSTLPKIFVSIHHNAGPTSAGERWAANSMRGVEVWYHHASLRGQKLAEVFQRHIVTQTGARDRGVKSRPQRQFYVLRHTRMPAVLTESGFMNNYQEVQLLLNSDYRQLIADGHVAAILEIENNGIE